MDWAGWIQRKLEFKMRQARCSGACAVSVSQQRENRSVAAPGKLVQESDAGRSLSRSRAPAQGLRTNPSRSA